jgi:rubrerythrin
MRRPWPPRPPAVPVLWGECCRSWLGVSEHHTQRWCQPCAKRYKSQRYWRLRAEAAQAETAPVQAVIPAPVLAERPLVLCQLCGYGGAWFERSPGAWRCPLCGRGP